MLYAVYCVDKPNSLDRRMELRPAHLDYLKGFTDRILLAGATLTDDGASMTGSFLVVNVADRAEAEAFSKNDPFTKGGLFESVSIKRMRKGLFNPAAAPAE